MQPKKNVKENSKVSKGKTQNHMPGKSHKASLELCVRMGISFLYPLCLACLLFSAICKASSDNHFSFLHFLFLWMVLITPPVQCLEPLSIVLQALCLSDLTPESICHFHCIIIRDLFKVIPEESSGFPYFLQFRT